MRDRIVYLDAAKGSVFCEEAVVGFYAKRDLPIDFDLFPAPKAVQLRRIFAPSPCFHH